MRRIHISYPYDLGVYSRKISTRSRMAQRWFDRESPWIQYVSQSSYWVYLAHMPLVAIAGWWLVQYDLPSPLKFLLVCGFTTVVALLTFHYWVQKTWLGGFLHGRRFDLNWPWHTAEKGRKA